MEGLTVVRGHQSDLVPHSLLYANLIVMQSLIPQLLVVCKVVLVHQVTGCGQVIKQIG